MPSTSLIGVKTQNELTGATCLTHALSNLQILPTRQKLKPYSKTITYSVVQLGRGAPCSHRFFCRTIMLPYPALLPAPPYHLLSRVTCYPSTVISETRCAVRSCIVSPRIAYLIIQSNPPANSSPLAAVHLQYSNTIMVCCRTARALEIVKSFVTDVSPWNRFNCAFKLNTATIKFTWEFFLLTVYSTMVVLYPSLCGCN